MPFQHRDRKAHKVQPIERFPTKPRRDGRFQKRIRGQLYYFGRDGDRAAALAEYDRVKNALYEGRAPRQSATNDDAPLTLHDLAYRFLDEKLAEVKAGRLKRGTYDDYVSALKRFTRFIGNARIVSDLSVDDFASYGRFLHGKVRDYAFNRERACVAALFNHAAEADWIDRPVKLGRQFRKVPQAKLRKVRRQRLVPPGVVQACVREARGQLRAIILLAALGGFGATDCAELTWEHVDLDERVIRLRRAKTHIARETPLPAETVDALRDVRRERPNDSLVFRTRQNNPWVRQRGRTNFDAIGQAWTKLQAALQMPVVYPFYALRHTFATHANELQDRDAYRRVMGRKLDALDALGDVYVETVMRARLVKLVQHVRDRLLPAPEMVYA